MYIYIYIYIYMYVCVCVCVCAALRYCTLRYPLSLNFSSRTPSQMPQLRFAARSQRFGYPSPQEDLGYVSPWEAICFIFASPRDPMFLVLQLCLNTRLNCSTLNYGNHTRTMFLVQRRTSRLRAPLHHGSIHRIRYCCSTCFSSSPISHGGEVLSFICLIFTIYLPDI